ncbi:MAG: glycosyltransferase family 39 protein [Anaerolineaceae bacterium]|nr:glycosyltransferase family 39 protein [Anaerolineaceae bacterium]
MHRYILEITAGIIIIFLAFSHLHTEKIQLTNLIDNFSVRQKKLINVVCSAILFTLFIFLITFKVNEVPTPYNVDEAGMAYDALNIANYGVDRYLYKNPVYFINFGEGQSVLYGYLTVLMIKLFGFNVISIRLTAIILSIISTIVFTKLIKNEFGRAASLISLALLCILPFSIMHSRWGLDAFLLFPMIIISSSVLFKAIRNKKNSLFLIAGFFLGITLYTYVISYVFLVIFLAFFIPILLYIKRINLKQIITMGIPLFFLAIPLLLMLAVNFGLIEEIKTSFISVPKLLYDRKIEISIGNIFNNLKFTSSNIFYRIFFHDIYIHNSLPKFGNLYHLSIPIIILGAFLSIKSSIISIRKKTITMDLMITCLFFSAFITTAMLSDINVHRSCEIFYPLIYFLLIGIKFIYKKSNFSMLLLTGSYIVLSILFFKYYFIYYEKDTENNLYSCSLSEYKEVLSFVDSLKYPENEKKDIYVIGKAEPNIYTMLALNIDPYSFDKEKTTGVMDLVPGIRVLSYKNYHFMTYLRWDGIPDNYIYIFLDRHDIPWKMDLLNFETKYFNSMIVYYPSE